MALDPASLFVLADRLLDSADVDETTCRTVINRVYYACHLIARDRLYGLDAQRHGSRRPSHVAIVEAVRVRLAREHGDKLRRLKRMREVADYIRDSAHPEVQSVFTREEVSDWAGLAVEARATARDLLPLLQVMPTETA